MGTTAGGFSGVGVTGVTGATGVAGGIGVISVACFWDVSLLDGMIMAGSISFTPGFDGWDLISPATGNPVSGDPPTYFPVFPAGISGGGGSRPDPEGVPGRFFSSIIPAGVEAGGIGIGVGMGSFAIA